MEVVCASSHSPTNVVTIRVRSVTLVTFVTFDSVEKMWLLLSNIWFFLPDQMQNNYLKSIYIVNKYE